MISGPVSRDRWSSVEHGVGVGFVTSTASGRIRDHRDSQRTELFTLKYPVTLLSVSHQLSICFWANDARLMHKAVSAFQYFVISGHR
jgi:hypothetical protein